MTDRSLTLLIANLLRGGVSLAAAIVLGAGICYVVQHPHTLAAHHTFQGEPEQYRNIAAIAAAATGGDCLAIIQFGLLLLIATPVARVAFSIAAFALEKDWMYTAITIVVLAVLLYSLLAS
jgi:uncharacterized membrane protein